MAKIITEFDLQNPTVIADDLAPVLGERIGEYYGNVQDLVAGLQGAGQLLMSGDGLSIATSMAGFIKAFTGWLRSTIEGNAEQTAINLRNHQVAFMSDLPIAWMTRKDVGAKRKLEDVVLKRKLKIKMSDMLKQYAPGALFAFERIGWDVVRRSFPNTAYPNAFDDGQPDIVSAIQTLPEALADKLRCMSDVAALTGRGCCYYPGEKIQFSFGTFPYIYGYSVIGGKDTSVDPEIPLVRHVALMTPSAHHVLIDEAEVYWAYKHWLKWSRLTEIPAIGKGQKDPGIYIDDQGLPVEIGGAQYWQTGSDAWSKVSGQALRDVTTSFYQFFVVRQMVLRQFEWLAPKVKEAAKNSNDERIRKLARGENVPLWKWSPFDPLVQLEQLVEDGSQGGGAVTDDSKDEPRPKRVGRPEEGSGVPWIEVGAVLAGVGGAAYVKRDSIKRWVRERVRR